MALVAVPEAAIEHDHGVLLVKHKVRRARKIGDMHVEDEAATPELFFQRQFWFRVPAADRRHVAASGRGVMNVGHYTGIPT
jgi:hypothetical protein